MRHVMWRLGLGLAALILGAGCSPKSESSDVRLQFPDWKAMREADLARQSKVSSLAVDPADIGMIVVNVTGPGITAPVFFSWENRDGQTSTPPTQISLTVPKGSDRLVQVLTTFEGSGTMQFYYADTLATISSDIADVSLTLMNVATSSSLVEGNISGRYLTAENQGPTGVFEYRFNPPGGKPSMIVHHGEMFGGWLELFSLSSPFLSYTLPDGTPIFQGLHNGSPALFPTSNPARTLSARLPSGYEVYNDQSGVRHSSLSGPRRMVVGFFGPGAGLPADTKRVCYSSGTTDSLRDLYTDASGTAPIKWNGSLASVQTPAANEAAVERMLLSDGATLKRGGSNQASCSSSGSEWQDYVVLNHKELKNGDGALNFRGPFKPVSTTSTSVQYLKLATGTNKVTAQWAYLPGAQAALGGIGVFYRQNPSGTAWNDNDVRGGEGIRCNDLTTLSTGAFKEITLAASATSADITGITTAQAATLQVIVCPLNAVSGRYFQSAIMAVGLNNGPSPELRVTGPQNIQSNPSGCNPFTIARYVDGAAAPTDTALSINLNVYANNASPGTFFSDASCTTGNEITSVSMAAGQSSAMVYYRDYYPGLKRMSAAASGSSGREWEFGVVTTGTAPSQALLQDMGPVSTSGPAYVQGYCYPLNFVLTDGSGGLSNDAVRSYTLSDSSGGSFYTDETCSTGLISGGTVSFTAIDAFKKIYFKPGATTGYQSITSASATPNLLPLNFSVATASVTSVRVALLGASYQPKDWYSPGECVKAKAKALASNGAVVKLPGSTFSLTSAADADSQSVQFSMAADCSNPTPTASVSFNAYDGEGASQEFFVKMPVALSANASAAVSGITSKTYFNSEPDSIEVVTPTIFMDNYCHKLTLQALRAGSPFVLRTGTELKFQLTPSNSYGTQFFADGACGAALPNGSVAVTGDGSLLSTADVWVRASSGGGNLTTSLTGSALTAVSTGITPQYFTMSVNYGAASPIAANQCVALMVTPNNVGDSIDLMLDVVSSTNLVSNGSGGYLFSDSACGAPKGTLLTIPAGTSGSLVLGYVRFASTLTDGTGPSLQLNVQSTGFLSTPASMTWVATSCSSVGATCTY